MNALSAFFNPEGVAIIGASAMPGKLGHGVVENLVRYGYQGAIYPVNPRAERILGLHCYPDIGSVPDPLDLAVIIIPAPRVPAALLACVRRGIKAASILSGGFAEAGEAGIILQREVVEIVRDHGIRVVGPNCVGTLSTHSGLNTTFLEQMPDAGQVAVISQSGAIGGAMIDWGKGRHFGLSHFASLGNTADVDEADLLTVLEKDPHAGVIVLYLEGLEDGRRLMEVAHQVAQIKPVIALKAGSTGAGARAVASHTAHLAGSDETYRTAFRQCGIIEAENSADLFGMALGLAYQPPLEGDRIAIVTNSGGPGALAADALTQCGLIVPEPDETTTAALRDALGITAQLSNPVDMLGAASTHEFEAAAEILLHSSRYDAVLAILIPNAVNDPVGIADGLARARSGSSKPVFACYMGDVSLRKGIDRLRQHHIPEYLFPEHASRVLAASRRWQAWRKERTSIPLFPAVAAKALPPLPATDDGILCESELYNWLQMLGLPVPPYTVAHSAAEAVSFAQKCGGPVALKIASPAMLHKSDPGGVRLNLSTDASIMAAYKDLVATFKHATPAAHLEGILVQKMAPPGQEVIAGIRRDPTFGPVLLCGAGGTYVEAFNDVALRIAPISRTDAREMITGTVAGRLLSGWRGTVAADIDSLIDILLVLSELTFAFDEIVEFEFNPIIVHPQGQGATIVDVRAIIDVSIENA